MARPRIDRTGQKFHHITIVSFVETTINHRQMWLCRCDCGVEKILCIHDVTRSDHPIRSCGCIYQRCQDDTTSFNQLYKNYKHGAAQRGYSFLLSKDEFKHITKMNCHYCGKSPNSAKQYRRENYITIPYLYNGIDRVDNSIGYVFENCVPCCKLCNYMKLDYSEDEFLQHVLSIAEYQSRKV